MKSDIPKVLHPLNGKPLIGYVIKSLITAGIDDILVVVGYKGEEVVNTLPSGINHVWQFEQLGTGHAVMQTEDYFNNYDGDIIITCGDVPLIKPETYTDLIKESDTDKVKAVVLTMIQDNPTGYGRILRKDGSFAGIVEEKDADLQQKQIKEVNTGIYVINGRYLFNGLKNLNTDNAQKEYYLPDVLYHIINSGGNVRTLLLKNSLEGSGVNTPEELLIVEQYLKKYK